MKKSRFSLVLIVIILISFSFSSYVKRIEPKSQTVGNIDNVKMSGTAPFIFGLDSEMDDLDPHNSLDIAVIEQVCEKLFAYNLTDPNLPIIPQLASDFGTWDGPNPDGTWNYNVPLRSGVYFHDGTVFNATAVKWSFDRLYYFVDNDLTKIGGLYEFYDETVGGLVSIINRVEIVNEFEVKFVLNKYYAPFEDLLTFPGSSILSPASTPATSFINTYFGDLVGTGPFDYDAYHKSIEEIYFHAFENYWGDKADIDSMIFKVISDDTSRNNALLSGTVHFIATPLVSFYSSIQTDPDTVLLDSGLVGPTVTYLGMNNNLINSTFRKAISYTIDYSSIIEFYVDVRDNGAVRAKSPIAEGMKYSNSTFDAAYFNITKARIIMQSMGYGTGLDPTWPGLNETEWTSSIFDSFNFTYHTGSTIRERLSDLLIANLSKIGIEITPAEISYPEFMYSLFELGGFNRDMLQLYWLGWGADFNDPSNIIDHSFTNRTIDGNGVQYNGYEAAIEAGRNPYDLNDNVQLLMEAALQEINSTVREGLYDRIQELLVEEDMPWAFLISPNVTYAHNVNLTNFPENRMGRIYFYPCQWNAPASTLSAPSSLTADTISWNQINLQWIDTESNEDGFRIQRKLGVTGDYMEIATVGPNINTYIDTDLLPGGIYYYRVQAYNFTLGSSAWSNEGINTTLSALAPILNVITPNPDIDGDIFLNWSDVDGASYYYVYRDTGLITDLSGLVPISSPAISQYNDNGLLEGTYYYVITGYNAGEETPISNCESATVDLPEPDAPVLSSITPNPDTDGIVNLEWNDIVGATSYNVYRDTSLITDISGLSPISSPTISQYNDTELAVGTYYYVITAVGIGGESLISNCESVEITQPPVTPRIPGFDLYLFLPIVSIILIGKIIRSKKKTIK
ncbi:MAG: ABC transporter substrate-binding protein [Promethearchaeota archaeon]